MISQNQLKHELSYAETFAIKRARKNGVAYHVIKLSDELRFKIIFKIDIKNPADLVKEYKLNNLCLCSKTAVDKVRNIVRLHEELSNAEEDVIEQAKQKGAGRAVIKMGARKEVVVFSRVSTRNKRGASLRYEVNGFPMLRDRLFDFIFESKGTL